MDSLAFSLNSLGVLCLPLLSGTRAKAIQQVCFSKQCSNTQCCVTSYDDYDAISIALPKFTDLCNSVDRVDFIRSSHQIFVRRI